MIVQFTQSGGYAGLIKGCELDTHQLPPEESKRLEQLLATSALPASGEYLSDTGRDLQQYEITIVNGASKSTVVFDDQSLPESAKPLIAYLKKCSKPKTLDQ